MISDRFEYLNHVMDVMTIYRSDIVNTVFTENTGIHDLFLDGITHRNKAFVKTFSNCTVLEIAFEILFDVQIAVGGTQFGKGRRKCTDIAGNGHIVVIEYNDDPSFLTANFIKCFQSHS